MSTSSGEFSSQGAIDDRPPPILFKFRQFPSLRGLEGSRLENARWHREQVFSMFRGQLRLAKPDSFNDPFEFRPAVTLVAGTKKEQKRSLQKYVWGAIRDNLSFKQRMRFRQNPAQVERVADNLLQITARSLEELRPVIELYCLSATETRPLLWSHYADGHRGIAVHFDATRVPFNLAWRVHYTNVYPKVVAGGERSLEENWSRLQTSLLIKDEDWSYEEEWRVLAPITDDSIQMLNRQGVTQRDGLLNVDPTVVVGVTLGAKMSADAADDLRSFILDNRRELIVRHARMAEGRFAIEVEPD